MNTRHWPDTDTMLRMYPLSAIAVGQRVSCGPRSTKPMKRSIGEAIALSMDHDGSRTIPSNIPFIHAYGIGRVEWV